MEMERTFHLCLSPDVIASQPELLKVVRHAGVSHVWTTGFLYGHWHYSLKQIQLALDTIERSGLTGHVANVPLGHPGDSLGAQSGDVPLNPPKHWRMGKDAQGIQHSGTSLHPPAVEENARAIHLLHEMGVGEIFLDDDFRLAVAPGMIGGCYCDDHRLRFLSQGGYADGIWDGLRDDVRQRNLTSILEEWVSFTCEELSTSYRKMQSAAPDVDLGIMVMYLGSEKAGIRLEDYTGVPFRVGELMFDDASFDPVKGKTDELFSVLFHRRFTPAELAYSESTAFPADQLSAANMAAKLNISLIADVRNTMFMSGLTPFPFSHWEILAPAISRQRILHEQITGQQPRGPFKHFWGMPARLVGDDQPFSLFLAAGIPFEVVDRIPASGMVFLGKADAQNIERAGEISPEGEIVTRRGEAPGGYACRQIDESLQALFELKHEFITKESAGLLKDTPYIVDDFPAVCAWYPDVGKVLVWNLGGSSQNLTIRINDAMIPLYLASLGVKLVDISGLRS